MITPTAEHLTLHKQIEDVNLMLSSVVAKLTLMGNPIVSTAIQDITRVSDSLSNLERGVNEQLTDRRSQLKALMGHLLLRP